jgi:small subunit ribosomal protein S24e
MEIKVSNEFYNPLLKRKEITLVIDHSGEGTPQRFDIRKRMASKLNAKIENVFVISLDTSTGLQRSTCALEVYDDSRAALSTVPEHVVTRNLPAEERVKAKEAKTAKPEKAAKPAEKREAKLKETEAKPAPKAEQKGQAEPVKPAK